MSEMIKRNSQEISDEQAKNIKRLCEIIMSGPEEKRDILTIAASAYTDGFIAGEAIAASRNGQ